MRLTQVARTKRWRSTPRGKYSMHRHNAKKRGIAFLFTFDEWWAIWQESGLWDERGSRRDQYAMMRRGDEGPYAVGNVEIGLNDKNARDGLAKIWRERTGADPCT